MVSDTYQNLYIKTALSEQGLRPVETLFPEESSRLKLVRSAVINLAKTGEVIAQEQKIHPSILQIMENDAALTHADAGVKEFEASRQLDPEVVEDMIRDAEAYAGSPEGRAEVARSIANEIHPEVNLDLEQLLSAAR